MYKRFLCKVTQIKKLNLDLILWAICLNEFLTKSFFAKFYRVRWNPINVSRLTFLGCATVGPPVYQPLYLSAEAYRPAALRRSPSTGNTGKIQIIRHILQTSEFNNYTGVHKVLCSTENSLFYQCPKLCSILCCIKLRQHTM